MKQTRYPHVLNKFSENRASGPYAGENNSDWLSWKWQNQANASQARYSTVETPYFLTLPTDSSTPHFKSAEHVEFLAYAWKNSLNLGLDPLSLGTSESTLDLSAMTSNPMRIDAAVIDLFQKSGITQINLGFNHPNECTREALIAAWQLADAGFILSNRATLLKGINDNKFTLQELNHRLLMMRVRPYCLFCYGKDMEMNTLLKPSIEQGIELIDSLRGWTSGLAVPFLVVKESPLKHTLHGPNYIKSQVEDEYVFRNYKNEEYPYHGS